MSGAPFAPAVVDPSGAIAEAAHACSRRRFITGAGTGALALGMPGAALAQRAGRAGADAAILNFALTLEYLQAGFYTEAERMGALKGQAARTARVIGGVERAHVAALRAALGRRAVAKPFFDFKGTTEDDDMFLRTAVAFEDLGTAAYKQQLTRIAAPGYLAAAASIHSVEARHAAWIRFLVDAPPAADALDAPIADADARRLVAATGFIRPRPRTSARRSPAFTG